MRLRRARKIRRAVPLRPPSEPAGPHFAHICLFSACYIIRSSRSRGPLQRGKQLTQAGLCVLGERPRGDVKVEAASHRRHHRRHRPTWQQLRRLRLGLLVALYQEPQQNGGVDLYDGPDGLPLAVLQAVQGDLFRVLGRRRPGPALPAQAFAKEGAEWLEETRATTQRRPKLYQKAFHEENAPIAG